MPLPVGKVFNSAYIFPVAVNSPREIYKVAACYAYCAARLLVAIHFNPHFKFVNLVDRKHTAKVGGYCLERRVKIIVAYSVG